MENVIQNWLLAFPYLAAIAMLLVLAYLAGGLMSPALPTPKIGMGGFVVLARTSAGVGVFSLVASILGVAHAFYLPWILAALTVATIGGWRVGAKFATLKAVRADIEWAKSIWSQWPMVHRLGTALVIVCAAIMSANAIVGSLVPDMGQDPLWYHLTVPLKWVFVHGFVCLPDVVPSNYPLAANALYAVLLMLGGDEVHCSLLYACMGVIAVWSCPAIVMASLPAQISDARRLSAGVFVIALWVPVLDLVCAVAPIPPANDMIAAQWLILGTACVWHSLLRAERCGDTREWIAAGVFLGLAISAKLTAIGFAGAGIVIACVSSWAHGRATARAAFLRLLACLGVLVGVYAPWAVRSYMYNGLPMFPLGGSLFAVRRDFRAALEVSQGMNDVSGLLTGHFAQWFEASWKTFRLAARMGNYPFYLFGSLAILLILAGRRAWRAYGVFLAVCFGSVLLYKGQNEILRYHSLVYAAAGSAVGLLCLAALSRVRGVVLLIAAMMAWLGLVGMFVVKQNEWASLRTVQWPYRPVLSQADVIARATFTEKGPLYTQLREASQFIPRESVVFLPDCNFPFYLKRNMIWGDAVMENGVGKTFLRSSPENALFLLQSTQADRVLILDSNWLTFGPVPDLLKSGHLRLTNESSGWHLFAYTPSIGRTK